MTRQHTLVAATAVCVAGVALAGRVASAADTVSVVVPFKFCVMGKQMPPGRYELRTEGEGETAILVRNVDNGRAALAPVIERVAENGGGSSEVLFDRVAGKRYLSEVQVSAGEGYIVGLGKGKENPELAAGRD